MENNNENLIRLINKYRKIELFEATMVSVPIFLYIMLSPIIIWTKFQERDLFIMLIILIGEIVLILKFRDLIKSLKNNWQLKNNRIYKIVQQPDLVTEIFIYPDKISFDIRGAENVEFKVGNCECKNEFVTAFREFFGTDKIILDQF